MQILQVTSSERCHFAHRFANLRAQSQLKLICWFRSHDGDSLLEARLRWSFSGLIFGLKIISVDALKAVNKLIAFKKTPFEVVFFLQAVRSTDKWQSMSSWSVELIRFDHIMRFI